MGCDIYGIIEQRKPGGEWEDHCVTINLGRNYSVFANLSGVRGHGDESPVAESRGLPTDACEKTRMSSRENYYCSHSWCTLDELKAALKASTAYDMSYIHLHATMSLTETWGRECRFVFWFDN